MVLNRIQYPKGVCHLKTLISGAAIVMMMLSTGGPAQTIQSTNADSSQLIDVNVTEGTSMSVSVSPDGRTLAMDLQGSIWTVPASGGTAKRITDLFNDARQPMWSPDGKSITFFGYRDGGYDLWAVAPDGTHQHKGTWGPFDDREPIFSHDGTKVAFSSDRGNPLGSNYNIWVVDLRSGEFKQLTKNPPKIICRAGRPTIKRSPSHRRATAGIPCGQ